MSGFVEDHVKHVFHEAGYGVLKVDGDRGGIVQGDGLRIVVAPFIEAAARRFGADETAMKNIAAEAKNSPPLKFDLYGGSVSADLEGIYFPDAFIDFMKEECRETYYRAQREVNAIFDAEDPPNKEWGDSRQAYVGPVAAFAAEAPDGWRAFVQVRRVADQSFNAYDEPENAESEVADILEGRMSHGAVEIDAHFIQPDRLSPDGTPIYVSALDQAVYGPAQFVSRKADSSYRDSGLIWTRDASGAQTLALAAEIASDEGNENLAAILEAKAIELGLPVLDNEGAKPSGL